MCYPVLIGSGSFYCEETGRAIARGGSMFGVNMAVANKAVVEQL